MKDIKYRKLPPLVTKWLTLFDAWLVGSAAKWYVGNDDADRPDDYDVIVSPSSFGNACKLIARQRVGINNFGGVSFISDGESVDVWASSLDDFIKTCDKRGNNVAVRLLPRTIVRWHR